MSSSTHTLLLNISFILLVLTTHDYVAHEISTLEQSQFRDMPSEKALINILLNRSGGNGMYGRPVLNSSDAVEVQHKLQLIQILDLDENQQILVSNCWSNLKWKDELLHWDPKEFHNIKKIRVNQEQLWTPDIFLYNIADKRMDDKRPRRAVVSHDGTVLWVPQSLFKSTCSVEITYFPYDSQLCKYEFGSWTYDQSTLDLVWWKGAGNTSENFIDHNNYMTSNEWISDGEPIFQKLMGLNQSEGIKVYRKDSTKQLYPVLRYILRIKRNPAYYISILIVPCLLLSTLTLVIFWLPPESPAKLLLGMSIFVAFFVLLILLGDLSPTEVKNFPLIGAYFCLNMIMITLTTFLATIIINIHFRGRCATPLPKFIRRLIIDGIGTFFLLRKNIDLPTHKIIQQIYLKKTGATIRTNSDRSVRRGVRVAVDRGQYRLGHQVSLDSSRTGANEDPTVDRDEDIWMNSVYQRFRTKQVNTPYNSQEDRNQMHLEKQFYSSELVRSHLEFERDVREINRYLRVFNNQKKRESSYNLLAMEYRALALVLDRLFSVLYVSSILIAATIAYCDETINKFELNRNITNNES